VDKKKFTFTGILEELPQSPHSGMVLFPYGLMEAFGKKSVKVKITYDTIPYRGLLKRMGGDRVYCLILKEIRKQLGKQPGDTIVVTIEEDTDERTIDIAFDFRILLEAHPEEYSFFNQLSFTSRKEYILWVESAKKQETRLNRLENSLVLLKQKNKKPH
jgi:bifunctional DNA-binding transcriptional regulator/antitoxin component of YhaV-PrlF toxin-antitoxin module